MLNKRTALILLSFALFGLALGGGLPNTAYRPAHAQGGTATPQTFTPLPEPTEGSPDEAALKQIDLKAYPILPDLEGDDALAGYVRAVYTEGQRLGNHPAVFSKAGDCMTANPDFLTPFAKPGGYDLGEYQSLQAVIDYYAAEIVRSPDSGLNSFSNPSLAAASGFNAASVLDPTWSDPALCGAEESPLSCEYRLSRPAVALILFGTNDQKSLTLGQFDYYLRRVLVQTLNAGIVPLVSTFPNQPGFVEKSILFNQVVVRAALDYNVPLINLWRAFEPLPDQGIDPKEPTHMTTPASGNVASFAPADLTAGHNMHNLLTLQALEALRKLRE